MMPLSMSGAGEAQIIKKIGGKEEVRSFLEKLGFVVGTEVTVISEIAGNMIVNVKGARVAIGKDMANKIMAYLNILPNILSFFPVTSGTFEYVIMSISPSISASPFSRFSLFT